MSICYLILYYLLYRCSVVESMIHLAATVGPFLSRSLKLSFGPLAVFIGEQLLMLKYFCHLRTIFIASGCCHLINILYCISMKDPTKNDKKKKITVSNLFAFSHFVDSFKTVIAPREGSRRAILITLLFALFIVQNIIPGELDILYIFLANTGIAHIFDYFFGFKNFLGAIALLVILPLAK